MDRLTAILRDHQPLLVALSGGVDSSLLLAVAAEVLGVQQVAAATVVSEGVTPEEVLRARRVAEALGVRFYLAVEPLLEDAAYAANGPDRCYHCRRHMYRTLREVALARSIPWIADGTHADDDAGDRPGFVAREEAGVLAPLRQAGWGKERIRAEARRRALVTAEEPANACLASRLPTGTPVTLERFAQVARAEAALRAAGLGLVRVRHHGPVARVELGEAELARLPGGRLPEALERAVLAAGFERVEVARYHGGRVEA
ncbi:MAG: hypothetical protein D6739_03920 [Nitrospirae bacterium]|nr:MAG: hypothetical protein D6739_03920 [Nitrospirota bacterium]